MKKTVLTLFTISCLLFTMFLMRYKVSVKATPGTIYVPTQYPTIQEAINDANSGDTIFVYNQTYYENVFVNKSVSLIGEDRETTIIDGNGAGSVITVKANNVKINGFTIQKSGNETHDSGILIDQSSGNDISHNTITNNYHGIRLESSRGNTISGNNVSSNSYHGIRLESSSANIISRNTVTSNDEDGIRLDDSSNNVISDNIASSNDGNGIRLSTSNENVVSGNTISSNDGNGIRLSTSTDNVISCNTVTSNEVNGIRLVDSSDNNTIYHNNFDNIDQVRSESVNAWDNGVEGNYWSDYTGQDPNKDGIGDTPRVIDMNNRDNHPLMGMFSDFEITWQDKTYHAHTICNSTISNFRFETGKETESKIISFNVTGEDRTIGFCRIMTPTEAMNYSLTVLIDGKEISPTILDASNATHTYLYFTYTHSSHTVTIISSKLVYLYNELLDKYTKLQTDFHELNSTYHELLEDFEALPGNFTQILEDYNQLLERYSALNASYQEHLLDYSELQGNHTALLKENTQNIQNLTYVFIATTAIFIIAAVYLSTHAHRKVSETKKP